MERKKKFIMTRAEELRREYEEKLAALKTEQKNCHHEWDRIKYDPEEVHEPEYENRWQGVDCFPELVGMKMVKRDRWSRTCKKCGKVQYTREKVAVNVEYQPKFSE